MGSEQDCRRASSCHEPAVCWRHSTSTWRAEMCFLFNAYLIRSRPCTLVLNPCTSVYHHHVLYVMMATSLTTLRPLPKAVFSNARWYGYVHVPKKKPRHVLGPGGAWRKCFVVHPTSETLDSLLKYQWLTKTATVGELPDSFSFKKVDETLLEDFERRAAEALAFQRPPKTRDRLEPHQALLQSLLASVWGCGENYPHLLQSHFLFEPKLECYWKRFGVNYITQPRPLFSLHTAQPLELFSSPQFTGDNSPPPIHYQPSHMGLFERSFDQIAVSGGCRRHSPFPFAHTLLLHSQQRNSLVQTDTLALTNLFAQTAGHTVQDGYPFNKHLHFPLSIQAVVSNGELFSFYCYQLNTLNLTPEDNKITRSSNTLDDRMNILWIGPKMRLYKEINRGIGLVGFNPECASLLLQFFFNDRFREKPEQSGFTLVNTKKFHMLQRRRERKAMIAEKKLARRIAKRNENKCEQDVNNLDM